MTRFTEQLADLVWDKLEEQTDDRLLEIIGECESRTTTNCGWVAYGLKDIVSDVAQNMLHLREEGHHNDEPESAIISMNINSPQPPPKQNLHPYIWGLVITDMEARDRSGVEKYGTHLQPFNGRDALVDAYQEALDLVAYLRQAIFERDCSE